MGKNLLYAHLTTKSNFKAGTKLTPKQSIGEMGESGEAYGRHLHFQYQENSTKISNFYRGNGTPLDPSLITSKYGHPTKNAITLKFKSTEEPYSKDRPHMGVDYSFNTTSDDNAYNVNVNAIIKEVGADNAFGNYVIIELVETQPPTKYVKDYAEKGTCTFTDVANVRNEPNVNSTILTTYLIGESVNYDRVIYNQGYIWLGYTRSSTGKRAYVTCGEYDQKTLKKINSWGKIV